MHDFTRHLPPYSPYPTARANPLGASVVRAYRGLSPTAKYLLTGGLGVAVLATGVVIYRAAVRPRPFQVHNAACSSFTMGTDVELDEAIKPIIREHLRWRPAVDPFAVTTDLIHRYAPDCRSYPEESRNPGEAELFVACFIQVIRVMDVMRLLTESQRRYFTAMIDVWARAHDLGGVAPVPPPAPPAQPSGDAAASDNPSAWRGI